MNFRMIKLTVALTVVSSLSLQASENMFEHFVRRIVDGAALTWGSRIADHLWQRHPGKVMIGVGAAVGAYCILKVYQHQKHQKTLVGRTERYVNQHIY